MAGFGILVCGLSVPMLMEPREIQVGLPAARKLWRRAMGKPRTWGSRWDSLLGHRPESREQGMASVAVEASLHAKLC